MAKVYAVVPGAEIRISHYGTATEHVPCLVPAAVGEELSKVEGLRVERDEPAPAAPRLAPKNRIPAPDVAAPSEKE